MSDGAVDALAVQTSFAQQSLWLQHQIDPDLPTYNVTGILRLSGPLDTAVLEAALNLVVDRHEVLRTVFELRDGAPVQIIRRHRPLTVPVSRIRPTDLSQAVKAEAGRLFDLGEGPLLRLSLLRLGQEAHVALLVMHHIITDGVSSTLLLDELAAQYEALLSGMPLEFPEQPIQYADFAVWQRNLLSGAHLARLNGYWTDRLAGLAPLELPADRPRPAVPSGRGAVHRFVMPAALITRLQELGRRRRATLFMVILAGLNVVLARCSGQRDVAVTTPMAGRIRPELESLIGCFVNPTVVRTAVAVEASFGDLLEQVKHNCTGDFDHQEMPFDRVLELARAQRSDADPARVILALQNMGRPVLRAAGLVFEQLDVDTGTAKADLLFDIEPGAGDYPARLEYRTDLFDRSTAERMAASLLTVLDTVASDPSLRLSRIPLPEPVRGRRAIRAGGSAPSEREAATGGRQADPVETQRVVAELPGVEAAAVVIQESTLVAFVVPEPDTRFDGGRLLDLAAERLPDGKVPERFVELEELPRLSSGGIDYGRLAGEKAGQTNSPNGYVAPRTPFEREIASMWAELLDADRVGVHDGFFELGGQSLIAVRLTARILDEFDVELTVRDLYMNDTVAETAWLVMRRIVEE
ncbi:condensation domain-containing protein [Nocardiopsis ansamitocini]|uniref:Carrier domain-containing protein n=1 Tax=Nocardiopsis ansamitocini TaxID=1670832 RepID=A0A9W6ULK4_9ACTN|nr:condensation domain-containing protein [Nocardiopsis ansamitocini]GLU50165.1 hypothetical protein Nans01_45160 [Nocardiopsis ansamitocini]